MNDALLLNECKKALDIQVDSDDFDSMLNQKLLAVKSFMKGAGVSDLTFEDDLAIGVLVMGVSDLWETRGGEVKFSPVFFTVLNQLTAR